MTPGDVPDAANLRAMAFPPPFSSDLHWDPEHLLHHIKVFANGQFVAEMNGGIVGSCSNAIIPDEKWSLHANWGKTVGGPYIRNHTNTGTTLYGLDITVNPDVRRMGIGRAFYEARYDLVRQLGLKRYGTGCRLPDYRAYTLTHLPISISLYAEKVVAGETFDRTLTPLLRYGLKFLGVIEDYMEDVESGNAAALLEWTP